MTFVASRGLSLYREKLLLKLSRKIANIITRQVNALKWYLIKILTVFSNLFERMERIGIKSPIKNNFWLFKDFKSFEGFLETHFASYALFSWTLKIYDVRTFVTSVLALWSVFGQNARAPSRSQSFLSVIQSDKRLPEIRPGSNKKYFWRNSGRHRISSLFTRETSRGRGVAGSIPRARFRVLK